MPGSPLRRIPWHLPKEAYVGAGNAGSARRGAPTDAVEAPTASACSSSSPASPCGRSSGPVRRIKLRPSATRWPRRSASAGCLRRSVLVRRPHAPISFVVASARSLTHLLVRSLRVLGVALDLGRLPVGPIHQMAGLSAAIASIVPATRRRGFRRRLRSPGPRGSRRGYPDPSSWRWSGSSGTGPSTQTAWRG
jgi:hypothetical protein